MTAIPLSTKTLSTKQLNEAQLSISMTSAPMRDIQAGHAESSPEAVADAVSIERLFKELDQESAELKEIAKRNRRQRGGLFGLHTSV